jgi:hypothetical protein
MPDVDLAAIRASYAELLDLLAEVEEELSGGGWDVETATVRAKSVAAFVAREDLPALLTALGRRDARITRLQKALAESRREAACYRADHRDRHGLPSDPRHAGCRAAEEAAFERVVLDRWHVARDADCPVYGCDGERVELEVAGGPSFVRLSCSHDDAKPLSAPVSLQNAPAHPLTRETPSAPA